MRNLKHVGKAYRPAIPIDWDRVEELLKAGCLGTEVAAYFSMHPQTFYDRVQQEFGMGFTEYKQQKTSSGEALIREVQFLKAIGKTTKGDNTLLIWLGKQRLNQKESISEFTVCEEVLKPFSAIMHQISGLQEDRKICKSKLSKDAKSELRVGNEASAGS